MAANNGITVVFVTADGAPCSIPNLAQGWTVKHLLTRKKGYTEQQFEAALPSIRVNDQFIEDVANYVLQNQDTVSLLPSVKGGKA